LSGQDGAIGVMVERSIAVAADEDIVLDLQQRLREMRSEAWPEAAPDEMLLLSGGPVSDLAGRSLIAGPPHMRVVLRQPEEVEPRPSGDALRGELDIAAPPPLDVVIERWSAGWQPEERHRAATLAEAFAVAETVQPPLGTGPVEPSSFVRPGCIAGLLGYDLGRWTSSVRLASPPEPGSVLGLLYIVDAWFVHDRRRGRLQLIAEPDHPWATLDPDSLLGVPARRRPSRVEQHCAIESESDDSHAQRVRAVIDGIEDGHLYQLNYGRRWSAPLPDDPWLVMRRLAETNPAPCSGWLHAPDLGLAIASSSPESLLSIDGRRLASRPIKGTRPRGRDAASDALLMREMVASRKEVAEHMMLVDLERNDIGRVCAPGTVRWSDWRIEALPQVQHMVSEVSGRLRSGVTLGDAVQALFPGGSITGCPKVATMAAISQLEGAPRGAWTGSLGIHDPRTGTARWNILIRTLEAHRGVDPATDWHATVQAGGGIVVESEPVMEVEEARWKAAALLTSAWSTEEAKEAGLATAESEHHAIPAMDERTAALLERLERERSSLRDPSDGPVPAVAVGSIIPPPDDFRLAEPVGLRCLLIDNLDSFTWNIVHALTEAGADVVVVSGRGPTAPDGDPASLLRLISGISPTHIILGPGPSTPTSSPLTLALADLAMTTSDHRFPPLLGICLGHQALGMAAGWPLRQSAGGAVHGVPSRIVHDGSGLFPSAAGRTTMMRYHSLAVSQPVGPHDDPSFDQSSSQSAGLVVNGWTEEGVVMAIRHRTRPVHGIQFHPESCGSPDGSALLQRFLTLSSEDEPF